MLPPLQSFATWEEEKQWAFAALPLEWTGLPGTGFQLDDITSPWTIDYNCIAYAAKDFTQPWWPMPLWIIAQYGLRFYHWPPGLPREDTATVENFFRAFETLGYKRCRSGKHQRGYEKVAIYVDASNVPQHMARELGDGVWYSKLGDYQDIRHHGLEGAECATYGQAKYFMRKRLNDAWYTKWLKKLLKIDPA